MFVALGVIFFSMLSAIVLVRELRHAPIAYQDFAGFHVGEDNADDLRKSVFESLRHKKSRDEEAPSEEENSRPVSKRSSTDPQGRNQVTASK